MRRRAVPAIPTMLGLVTSVVMGMAMAVSVSAQFSFQFTIQGHEPPTPWTGTPESVSYIEALTLDDNPWMLGARMYGQQPGTPFDTTTTIGELEDIIATAAAGNGQTWYDHVIFANLINRFDPAAPTPHAVNLSRVMIARSAIVAGPTTVILPRTGQTARQIIVRKLGAAEALFLSTPLDCWISQQMRGAPIIRPFPIQRLPFCAYDDISVAPFDLLSLTIPLSLPGTTPAPAVAP